MSHQGKGVAATKRGRMDKAMSKRIDSYETTPASHHKAKTAFNQGLLFVDSIYKGAASENAERTQRRVASTHSKRSGKSTKEGAAATFADLHAKLVSQAFCCATCGQSITPSNAETDHIIPIADGGSDEPHNIQWLCKPCNRAKGELSLGAFVAMCQRVSDKFLGPSDD